MQVALNQAYAERLNFATDLLTQTTEEHSGLMKEVGALLDSTHKFTVLFVTV